MSRGFVINWRDQSIRTPEDGFPENPQDNDAFILRYDNQEQFIIVCMNGEWRMFKTNEEVDALDRIDEENERIKALEESDA